MTENGMELTSETRQVEYDKFNLLPEKVMMTFYNGWMKKNIDVEFNLIEGTTHSIAELTSPSLPTSHVTTAR